MKRRLGAFLLLPLLAAAARAQDQAPPREEQVIWSLMSYNGRDYAPTFCRQGSETVCLIADAASFATIRTTLVYWWPAAGQWYTDSRTLNVVHDGSLELRDRRGRTVTLKPTVYTYGCVRERYNQVWRVLEGAEAEAAWAAYRERQARYQDAQAAYETAQAAYEEEYAALATRVAALREAGRPFEAERARLEAMRPPAEPQGPDDWLVPPVEPRTGFVLRLAPGTYAARLLTPEGLVLEGSERTVVSFPRLRTGTVGYDIIPSDRWTTTVESNEPSSVIYSAGGVHLYVRPFHQDEYNDLDYRRAIRNGATGNPALGSWIKVRQVEAAGIEVEDGRGAARSLSEMPYWVEQSEGAALGYSIVPFDGQGTQQGQEPTLRAFDVPVPADAGVLRLRLRDAEGRRLEGGDRTIRVVRRPRRPYATLFLAAVPLAAGAAVLVLRRRKEKNP